MSGISHGVDGRSAEWQLHLKPELFKRRNGPVRSEGPGPIAGLMCVLRGLERPASTEHSLDFLQPRLG